MTMTDTSERATRPDGSAVPRRQSAETRRSIRTSELFVFLITSVLMIVVAYTDEAFDVRHGMTMVGALAVGYMLSRGIAKAGSRELYVAER